VDALERNIFVLMIKYLTVLYTCIVTVLTAFILTI